MPGVDFTSCRRVLGRAYNGANGKKIAVEYLPSLQREFLTTYLNARRQELFGGVR